MKRSRFRQLATAALATSALLLTAAGGVATAETESTDLGIDGFAGTADATSLEIAVGLPAELADGASDVLEGLGIAGENGIRISFAETQAQLRRAAEGEDVEGLARALHTNLLLDSPQADHPGECEGGDTIELPPDQDTPLLRIAVAGIDCEQTDERAFAHAEISEVTIMLGGLIEAGLPEDVRAGFADATEQFNQQLLTDLNDGACNPDNGETDLGDLFDGALGDHHQACEALELQLSNPWDVDVPLVSVAGLSSTSEVTAGDDEVAAEARATLAGVNVLGLVCVPGDGTDRLNSRASTATDGEAGEQSSGIDEAEGRHCPASASILRLVSDPEVFESIRVFEAPVRDALGGNLEELFDGLEEVFTALETTVVTGGEPYGHVDGAGAVAGVTPLSIVATAPFSSLPGFEDTPLGDISVDVAALGVESTVNAQPETRVVAAEPDDPLPVTGASAAGLIGLAALGAAVALRRRREDEG